MRLDGVTGDAGRARLVERYGGVGLDVAVAGGAEVGAGAVGEVDAEDG